MKDNIPTVWTIGHSTRTLEVFLEMLAGNEIEVLADIRRYPGSRKYPHFGTEPLRDALAARKLDYVALPELGGRRQPRPDSHNTVWRNESFRGYADYMETEGFRQGIERLMAVARHQRTVIMCAEAVWWRCHRALIADYLTAAGVAVRHIMEGKSEIHKFTAAARIRNGALSYASDQPGLI